MESFLIASAAAIDLLTAVPAGAQTSVTTITTETTGVCHHRSRETHRIYASNSVRMQESL